MTTSQTQEGEIFKLSDTDVERVKAWMKSKKKEDRGSLTYCFTYTGIGLSIIVKNRGDNTELDLSDYASW